MEEIYKLATGIFILLLGIPIGMLLAKFTREELNSGKIWFRIIVFTSIVGSTIALFLKNDYLLFSFLFIAIVASRSVRFKN